MFGGGGVSVNLLDVLRHIYIVELYIHGGAQGRMDMGWSWKYRDVMGLTYSKKGRHYHTKKRRMRARVNAQPLCTFT